MDGMKLEFGKSTNYEEKIIESLMCAVVVTETAGWDEKCDDEIEMNVLLGFLFGMLGGIYIGENGLGDSDLKAYMGGFQACAFTLFRCPINYATDAFNLCVDDYCEKYRPTYDIISYGLEAYACLKDGDKTKVSEYLNLIYDNLGLKKRKPMIY